MNDTMYKIMCVTELLDNIPSEALREALIAQVKLLQDDRDSAIDDHASAESQREDAEYQLKECQQDLSDASDKVEELETTVMTLEERIEDLTSELAIARSASNDDGE